MIKFEVKSDISKVEKTIKRLAADVAVKAVPRALNKVAARVKTEAGRAIKQRYNVSARAVGRAITVKKAGTGSIVASVDTTGKPFPLQAFKARGKLFRGPVSVEVVRGQRKMVRHGFLGQTKSGHVGIFARGRYKAGVFVHRRGRDEAHKYPEPDLPITELVTFSVPRVFKIKQIQDVMKRVVEDEWQKVIDHEISFLLSKI